jgi:hypothetical protein
MMIAKNDRAEDADQGALRVDCIQRQGTQGGGDDGKNDARFCHPLILDVKDKFYEQWRQQKRERKDRLEEECL